MAPLTNAKTPPNDSANAILWTDGLPDFASLDLEALLALYGDLYAVADAPSSQEDTLAASDRGDPAAPAPWPTVQLADDADSVELGLDGDDHETFVEGFASPAQMMAAPILIIGDNDSNWLTGSGGVDHIYGRGGSDFLFGHGGDDWIFGENGRDYVFGEDGNDLLYGGRDADYIEGGSGADMLYGGHGRDFLLGGTGVDFFDGGTGVDTVSFAHSSTDWFVALRENSAWTANGTTEEVHNIENVLFGDGNDSVWGSDDDNVFWGGAGNDNLYGGTGDNDLYGGDGHDWLSGSNLGNDLYDGGDGIDTVSFSLSSSGVTAALWWHKPFDTGQGIDTIIDVENLLGSAYADSLEGDSGNNKLEGQGGADWLEGEGGNDYLAGDAGDDTLNGGLGNDVFDGGDGIDTASFIGAPGVFVDLSLGNNDAASTAQNTGQGIDSFIDIENVEGSLTDDQIHGNDDRNLLWGDNGDDWIWGHGGDDNLFGGRGADVLAGGSGNNILSGGDGVDAFFYGDNAGDGAKYIIPDFEVGLEKIFIEADLGITEFADITIDSNQFGQAVANFSGAYDGGWISFTGVSPDQIGADDFVFY
ncbi:MAG: calcium-binding protein [Methyloligellaceae bacterium]